VIADVVDDELLIIGAAANAEPVNITKQAAASFVVRNIQVSLCFLMARAQVLSGSRARPDNHDNEIPTDA
jgi:hypothetical protein